MQCYICYTCYLKKFHNKLKNMKSKDTNGIFHNQCHADAGFLYYIS